MMNRNEVIEPLETLQVNGRPIRLFCSPLAGPDLPWYAIGDLQTGLNLPSEQLRKIMEKWVAVLGKNIRTIETSEGPCDIASWQTSLSYMSALTIVGADMTNEAPVLGGAFVRAYRKQLAHLAEPEWQEACRIASTRDDEVTGNA